MLRMLTSSQMMCWQFGFAFVLRPFPHSSDSDPLSVFQRRPRADVVSFACAVLTRVQKPGNARSRPGGGDGVAVCRVPEECRSGRGVHHATFRAVAHTYCWLCSCSCHSPSSDCIRPFAPRHASCKRLTRAHPRNTRGLNSQHAHFGLALSGRHGEEKKKKRCRQHLD